MASHVLYYFPGSPFARMARVLVAEWKLAVRQVELPFPPSEDLFDLTPLGQVPVLTSGHESFFPTAVVLERLWLLSGRPRDAFRPEDDRQMLQTALLAGDALVAALYQSWSGLLPVGTNHVGYDPADRHLVRFGRTLAWLDGRIEAGHLRAGVTLPGVAVACVLLWSEARGGPEWRHQARLGSLVSALEGRESFKATRPQQWCPE